VSIEEVRGAVSAIDLQILDQHNTAIRCAEYLDQLGDKVDHVVATSQMPEATDLGLALIAAHNTLVSAAALLYQAHTAAEALLSRL
jgi:hypothetical protein